MNAFFYYGALNVKCLPTQKALNLGQMESWLAGTDEGIEGDNQPFFTMELGKQSI